MSDYYPVELFHWAGMKDEFIDELKDILTAHPEFIHETNRFGDNCLFIAVKAGNINMVKYIVENTDIDVNHETQDEFGNLDGNILLTAFAAGSKEIIYYFLENPNLNIHSRNNAGETIYHLCANMGDGDLMEKIIELDSKNMINALDKHGRHCLYNVLNNYKYHKDYWCFEVVQQRLSNEALLRQDNYGTNTIQFCEELQKKSPKMETLLAPLYNVLKTRF